MKAHNKGGSYTLVTALLLVLGILLLSPLTATAQSRAPKVTRHALIVGSNAGDRTRQELKYAIKDASAMADVLEELGGVDSPTLLENPDAETLEEEILKLDSKIKRTAKSASRQELIFYYSGHSDEQGLLLGEQHYPYQTLRDRLNAIDVDVKVVILDSCASGNFTRKKGGKRTPSFLNDTSSSVKGNAFLTSSAATESAQESDRLQGSFFTHAMISGLRGAADSSGDRRVTLNEAYQYAFEETLLRTQSTLGGAQHAAYDFDLSGHGELVLTDYGEPAVAILQLSRTLRGDILVRDNRRRLVAELNKLPGQTMEIALPAQTYEVHLIMPSRAGITSVNLKRSKTTRLTEEAFEEISREATALRGAPNYTRTKNFPIALDLLPRIGFSSVYPQATRHVSINLLGGMSGGLKGFEFSALGGITEGYSHGLQIAGLSNLVVGSMRGGQIAGLLNVATRGAAGTQLGGLNFSGDDLFGSQIGGANLTRGALIGSQIGALNMQFSGVQGRGLQLGATNISQAMSGLQLGALNLNLRHDVMPDEELEQTSPLVQVGAVNLSTKPIKGAMFGVINVAPTTNASFGVINVFWKEPIKLSTWVDSDASLNAGLIHGGRSTYNIYTLGVHHYGLGDGAYSLQLRPRTYSLGLGYGWKKAFSTNFSVRSDLLAQWLIQTPSDFGRLNLMNKARVSLIWKTHNHVAFYAGPALSLLLTQDSDRHHITPPLSWEGNKEGSTQVTMWPGAFIGIDFL